mmetsp:Transcript_18992/g.39017  ORF Transcript_18992/g.39017 Transcript_18992/m.39017 type:complete len:93 (-) Transcript_18992:383-661(-)
MNQFQAKHTASFFLLLYWSVPQIIASPPFDATPRQFFPLSHNFDPPFGQNGGLSLGKNDLGLSHFESLTQILTSGDPQYSHDRGIAWYPLTR